MTNGNKVRQAREFCGLTQKELADRIGGSQSTIATIEKGGYQPNEDVVAAIADATQFPVSFFSQGDSPDFSMGSLWFRARASVSAGEKLEAYQYGRLMFGIAEYLAQFMKRVPVRLPQLVDDPDDAEYPTGPIAAARITRAALGLSPNGPIPHLINALERGGVLVFSTPVPLEGRDAFSVWGGSSIKKPIIVASGGVPGDRLRFSIAHETGHLVLHPGPRGTVREIEKEANIFAGEFLMPEEAMLEELTRPVTLSSLATLKLRWGVSVASLIKRAFQLEVITERQQTYLYQQLSAHGWRLQEPGQLDITAEKPRALRKMAELKYGKPINYQKLATDVHLRPMLVRQIMEAHASAEELTRRSDSRGSDSVAKTFRGHSPESGSQESLTLRPSKSDENRRKKG